MFSAFRETFLPERTQKYVKLENNGMDWFPFLYYVELLAQFFWNWLELSLGTH